MNEIYEVNKVLEQIVEDIEKNKLDDRTYTLNNKNINMDTIIKEDLKKSFEDHKKMGIYMFAYKYKNKLYFVKIGKANCRSSSRFYNQHYKLNAATSTLAKHLYKSIKFWDKGIIDYKSSDNKKIYNVLKENAELDKILKNVKEIEKNGKTEYEYDKEKLKNWMEENLVRINIILDESLNTFVLNYVEAYLHLKYKPLYEGHINQKY